MNTDSIALETKASLTLVAKYSPGLTGERLAQAITRCQRCSMAQRRATAPLPFMGDFRARYVFVGRMPGEADRREGVNMQTGSPVTALFDSMLVQLGLRREDIFFTNAVFCTPARGRAIADLDLGLCSLWKPLEFSLLERPKFVFVMGLSAVRVVLGDAVKWGREELRGKPFPYRWKSLGNGVTYFIPMLHAGSVLRDRELEGVWSDGIAKVREDLLDPFRRFLAEDPDEEEIGEWEL